MYIIILYFHVQYTYICNTFVYIKERWRDMMKYAWFVWIEQVLGTFGIIYIYVITGRIDNKQVQIILQLRVVLV